MNHLSILLTFVFLLFCQHVNACDCIANNYELKNYQYVFVGEVLEIEANKLLDGDFGRANYDEVTFTVNKNYHFGNDFAKQTVLTPSHSAACGVDFKVGSKYFVFTQLQESELSFNSLASIPFVHACTPTEKVTSPEMVNRIKSKLINSGSNVLLKYFRGLQ